MIRGHSAALSQAGGRVDGFICSSGTGGTIGGVARYLKQASSGATQVYCIDPPGSGLHGLVTRGRAAAVREGESPSSPPGATPYEGDRVVRVVHATPAFCAVLFVRMQGHQKRPPLNGRGACGSRDCCETATDNCFWLVAWQVQYIERSAGDSITEGIGIDRLTANF
eukprot:COSAG01_NODE_20578_length_947_cov_1.090802_2_plen_166_part_01